MATVNKRANVLQAVVINGVDNGGAMSAAIQAGYDEIVQNAPDGAQVAYKHRGSQFVRGSVRTQDWTTLAELLAGTLGTYICYERKSGTAAATGYLKHTITNPIIYNIKISQKKGQYAEISFDFEVRFTAPESTIATMWVITDTQAAPTAVTGPRGGWRVETALHGAVNIYHVLGFDFGIGMTMAKACNDSDQGYTAVDCELEGGLAISGSLEFEDKTITSSKLKAVDLMLAAAAALVLTLKSEGGAANKVVTINGVIFTGGADNMTNSAGSYDSENLSFTVTNNSVTPLTLAGANKIIAIADAA